jgi:uncharacterized protein
VDLSLEAPGDYHVVRSVGTAGIQVGEQFYTRSLVLAADRLLADWIPQSFEELQAAHLAAIFQLEPDLVLLGTGIRQRFPAADFMMEFHRRGVGIEVMATAPACRTFNVLVSESRRAVAALLPLHG